jgi:hypothetical protein
MHIIIGCCLAGNCEWRPRSQYLQMMTLEQHTMWVYAQN